MQEVSKGKPILEEALKEMERFSSDEEISGCFTKEWLDKNILKAEIDEQKRQAIEGIKEAKAKGKAEGVLEGKTEGIKEGKIEIAKNMLDMNMPIKDISKITKLSIKEIEKLKDEL